MCELFLVPKRHELLVANHFLLQHFENERVLERGELSVVNRSWKQQVT